MWLGVFTGKSFLKLAIKDALKKGNEIKKPAGIFCKLQVEI